MTRLSALAPVPVRSFTEQRAYLRETVDRPDVGLRWGAKARFAFKQPEGDEASDGNGGVTLIQPEKHRTTERITRFTPVWRRYETWRVRSGSDPDQYIDVAVTTEALLPIGQETQRYIGGGIGYVIDPGRHGFVERVIHTYVHLTLPPPDLVNAEKIDEGTVGDWPSWPEDAWSGDTVAHQLGGTPYGVGGGAWDR